MIDMIKVLENILTRVATWPKEAQAELARAAQEIEQKHVTVYRLSDDERSAIEDGLAEAKHGEFISDADMEKFWQRNHTPQRQRR